MCDLFSQRRSQDFCSDRADTDGSKPDRGKGFGDFSQARRLKEFLNRNNFEIKECKVECVCKL